jgi:hypothetical protein
MFDDLPLFRNTDPETSVKGATDVKPRRMTQAMRLLAEYAHRDGLTDEEAGLFSGLIKTGYWKRCSELRTAGFIIPTGETRVGSQGSLMRVCAITEQGSELLAS